MKIRNPWIEFKNNASSDSLFSLENNKKTKT